MGADVAFITPELIVWARERARLTRDRVATRLGTEVESINSWEHGTSNPTLNQAHHMADILHVPFGYLFLPSPPQESIPLPDFRTAKGAEAARPSADLIDLVNDVTLKQQWYREFLLNEGRQPLPFVGRFSIRDPAEVVAEDIRSTLAIDASLRQRCANWGEFFTTLVRNAEAAGILVMRSGIVAGNTRRQLSTAEVKGFAISDRIAPLVFVNARDWATAQIFTITHEFVHVWINASGISNEDLKHPSQNDVERYCNATAAEVLLPGSEFRSAWSLSRSVDENANSVARAFRVSRLVALRRAVDMQLISWGQYMSRYRLAAEMFRVNTEEHPKRKTGGHAYKNILARNSATLTTSVVRAALEGALLYRDAARLLNVSIPVIEKINGYLAKGKEGA